MHLACCCPEQTRRGRFREEERLLVVHVEGYLAHEKSAHPQDPTVGLSLGPYGGPRGECCFL